MNIILILDEYIIHILLTSLINDSFRHLFSYTGIYLANAKIIELSSLYWFLCIFFVCKPKWLFKSNELRKAKMNKWYNRQPSARRF